MMSDEYRIVTTAIVRVERLQDISEADARAEGCGLTPDQIEENDELSRRPSVHGFGWHLYSARGNFLRRWCAIHGGIYAWDRNPWVAVYSFRPILGNIDCAANAKISPAPK